MIGDRPEIAGCLRDLRSAHLNARPAMTPGTWAAADALVGRARSAFVDGGGASPERLADAALGLWYLCERQRLERIGDEWAPAPGAAPSRCSWVSRRELRLWLPEYPPRYPVSFSGKAGVKAFELAGRRWRGLVRAAVRQGGASALGWERAVVRLTYHVRAALPPDVDAYSVRFVHNGLVEAGVLSDDRPACLPSYSCVTRLSRDGRLGTSVHVRKLPATS